MNKIPQISDAEWEVMKVLWNKSPITSSEIIEELKDKTHWNPKTIHTLIRRLVDKGAIKASKSNNKYYLFQPAVTEKECTRLETKSFIKKVYNGSFNRLVANFIKDEKLSSKEIDELKDILDKMKD